MRIARFARGGDVAYGVVGEAQGDGAAGGGGAAGAGSGLVIAELRGHPFSPGDRYTERPLGFMGDTPAVEIVCLACGETSG